MRFVLDTNVVASALLWGGTPRLLLQARREKRIELRTSMALLAELTDILGRRKFERKIAASMLSIDQIVDRYAELAVLVRPAKRLRDPAAGQGHGRPLMRSRPDGFPWRRNASRPGSRTRLRLRQASPDIPVQRPVTAAVAKPAASMPLACGSGTRGYP